jgi:DNA-binding transcriptional ArsR family regulator
VPIGQVRLDPDGLRRNGRPAAIALTIFTLRCMEQWRQRVDDYDEAMIMVSVVAISAERLLRTELPPELRDLANPIDDSRLSRCNVSSIASATGLNRETTRRKVNALIERGLLARREDGGIALRAGRAQEKGLAELIQRQLQAVVRLVNDLQRLDVIMAAD